MEEIEMLQKNIPGIGLECVNEKKLRNKTKIGKNEPHRIILKGNDMIYIDELGKKHRIITDPEEIDRHRYPSKPWDGKTDPNDLIGGLTD